MATTFQNRLAGTVIVVALAVIFLPDLLDGKAPQSSTLNREIPNKPIPTVVEFSNPFPVRETQTRASRQVEIVQDVALDEEQDVAPTNVTREASANEPAPDAIETPIKENTVTKISEDFPVADVFPGEKKTRSWVIQLGSFRHQKNVRDLLDKLSKANYRAFTNKVRTSSGDLTKVFVGPDQKKEQLTKALPHLNELTGLQGRVSEFEVK